MSRGLERNCDKMTFIPLYILYYSRILCFEMVKSVGAKGKNFIGKVFIYLVALKKSVLPNIFTIIFKHNRKIFFILDLIMDSFSVYFPLGICGGPEGMESCWVSSLLLSAGACCCLIFS